MVLDYSQSITEVCGTSETGSWLRSSHLLKSETASFPRRVSHRIRMSCVRPIGEAGTWSPFCSLVQSVRVKGEGTEKDFFGVIAHLFTVVSECGPAARSPVLEAGHFEGSSPSIPTLHPYGRMVPRQTILNRPMWVRSPLRVCTTNQGEYV